MPWIYQGYKATKNKSYEEIHVFVQTFRHWNFTIHIVH